RASAAARVGDHGGRRRGVHGLGRVVGGAVPGPGPDARGVLLQPAGRRPPRHHRSPSSHVTPSSTSSPVPLLAVDDLSVESRTRDGIVRALDGVSLSVGRGQTVGIVGESGSGKSVTALAIMGILHPAARVTAGQAVFGGLDLLTASETTLREYRG